MPDGGCSRLVDLRDGVLAAEVVVLLVGFAYAALADWNSREVSDGLWQGMGVIGVALGFVGAAADGTIAIVMWLVLGAFVLQHLFPWDEWLGSFGESNADLLEAVIYAVVSAVVLAVAWKFGVGTSGVPVFVLASFATVLFARGLFELGVLYGGADAKALMIAGVVVPLFASPWLPVPPAASSALAVVPFSVSLLMDAALLSLAIPIGLAIRNGIRGEFEFPRGFSGYQLDVRELPKHFVWLKDPLLAEEQDRDVETSEEDRQERERIARDLTARGVERVWVTPQIPFLVLMAAGAVAALLAGNLVLDLFAIL